MFDLEAARRITGRELATMAVKASALDAAGWERPTRCPGWTTKDVCSHAALAAAQQAEAFRRAMAGDMRPPEYPGAPAWSPAEVVTALDLGRSELDAALGALTPAAMDGMVPLPFGVVPTAVAIQIPVYEYAFHANDLLAALAEDEPLAADVAAAFLEFAAGLAPMLASGVWAEASAKLPSGGLAYRVAGASGAVELHNTGTGWQVGPATSDAPTCEISGDDSSVALFFMGRIPHSDARLKLSGSAPDAAAEFKAWFPGP